MHNCTPCTVCTHCLTFVFLSETMTASLCPSSVCSASSGMFISVSLSLTGRSTTLASFTCHGGVYNVHRVITITCTYVLSMFCCCCVSPISSTHIMSNLYYVSYVQRKVHQILQEYFEYRQILREYLESCQMCLEYFESCQS